MEKWISSRAVSCEPGSARRRLILHDTRPCATAFQHRMTGLDRELYRFCDTGRSLRNSLEYAADRAGDRPWSPKKISAFWKWVESADGLLDSLPEVWLCGDQGGDGQRPGTRLAKLIVSWGPACYPLVSAISGTGPGFGLICNSSSSTCDPASPYRSPTDDEGMHYITRSSLGLVFSLAGWFVKPSLRSSARPGRRGGAAGSDCTLG